MIDLPGLGEDKLRRRIRALAGADEGERVAALLAEADAALGDGDAITATATGLIEAIRGKQRYRAGINALLAEYSLSSREGVVLMCLAEALLRVPDRLTADRLIRDKLGGGDWRAHVGNSQNAAFFEPGQAGGRERPAPADCGRPKPLVSWTGRRARTICR